MIFGTVVRNILLLLYSEELLYYSRTFCPVANLLWEYLYIWDHMKPKTQRS